MIPLPRPVPQNLEPMKPPYSCEISDKDLKRLWAHAKPLYVSKETGELHWVKKPSDLRSVAYTWDPTESRTPAARGKTQTFASREFSPSQGGGNWYYEFVDDDQTYRPLEYNPRSKRWDKRAAGR